MPLYVSRGLTPFLKTALENPVLMYGTMASLLNGQDLKQGPNVFRTPILAMRCRQCSPLSVVQLKSKHCRKFHCRNGVVNTLRL